MSAKRSVRQVCLPVLCCATFLVTLVLATCGPAAPGAPPATDTALPAAQSPAQAESAATPAEPAPSSIYEKVVAGGIDIPGDPTLYPLVAPGPYYAGKRSYKYEDASRNNRRVWITVWYPALPPEGSSGSPFKVGREREPDRSGAPYPMLLSDSKIAAEMAPYLISHGFTWVSLDLIDTWGNEMSTELIDQPLDLLYALDQVANHPLEGLEGMIDAERVGVIGYSFGGFNTLALSGARIDPAYYLAQCPEPDATTAAILGSMSAYSCGPAEAWDEYAAHAPEAITAGDDGLWQPMTDERIRAVMPLAGEGWWLFGERGLAAVDRPTLIIAGTEDALYPENAVIFEHLGTPDKGLISSSTWAT